VLVFGADVLLHDYVPDVELSLYHTLVIVLLQGLLILPHIGQLCVSPFF
jgi:hypothetical protein